MKKLLIATTLSGFVALNAGQHIVTEVQGENLHLALTAHTDKNIVYFVDSDNNPATGLTCDNVKGIDFKIKNGEYYNYVGNDGECSKEGLKFIDKKWEKVGGEKKAGAHDLLVPLSVIAEADMINITAKAYDTLWKETYDYTQYGSDHKQMKEVDLRYNTVAGNLILFRVVSNKGTADEIADRMIESAKALGKGWGLAHDEDMVETLQKKADAGKLNEQGQDYLEKIKERGSVRILGFCNPNKAVKATYVAPPVTSMMPCRISVVDLGGNKVGISLVNATDPKFKPVMDDLKAIIDGALQ